MTDSAPTAEAWSAVAEDYDEFVTPIVIPLAQEVLGRIDLRPGTRLLDVAAGTGALSLAAARLGADVVATDIAPTMIERLQARAHDEGLSNLEGRIMDGLDLRLEDDTFDVSASQLGVTVIPNLERALDEMVRVTKAGGEVLIAALGSPQKAEFFGFFLSALKAIVPGFTGPPSDPPPPQFQVADPTTFHQRLAEAGLKEVSVETVTFGLEFRSSADLWGFLMSSNPMGRMLVANLTEDQRADLLNVLDGMLRERSNGNGTAVLNLDVNIGLGTK